MAGTIGTGPQLHLESERGTMTVQKASADDADKDRRSRVEGRQTGEGERRFVPASRTGDFDLHGAIGGTAGCRRLSMAFYARVAKDPLLRPLFPGKTMKCAIEEFVAFLAQFLGGPVADAQRRLWVSLRESHLRFQIGPGERAAWMKHMVGALEDAEIDEPARASLREFFEHSSAYVVNVGSAPYFGVSMETEPDSIHREIAKRWDAQLTLDDAVAAVRSGDTERALTLADTLKSQASFSKNHRSVLVGLFGVMLGSGTDAMFRYIQDQITLDPEIAHERYGGRTLLHVASARSRLTLVEFLLRMGADPNARDTGDHAPLYSLANECKNAAAGGVVRALVEYGANVNANGGVKHCTALHMAARRGNVEVAQALLECGADVEARDSLGVTPLRRALNCRRPEVAALLVRWGVARE